MSRPSRAKTIAGRHRALLREIAAEDPRHPLVRGVQKCCRPRMLGPAIGEGRLVRVIEVPCSAVVAASLQLDHDGTLPSLDEVLRRLAALPPAPRRVSLAVWR